jgi:hypothetical protein
MERRHPLLLRRGGRGLRHFGPDPPVTRVAPSGRWAKSDGYQLLARSGAHIRRLAVSGHPGRVGGRVTRTSRLGGNVDASRDDPVTAGTPQLLPMDASRQQRAVAALAALLIPLVRRDDEDVVGAHALDTADDMERSSDHADQ